jgi:uncharacterized protein YecE (DUF72 family)
VPDASPFKIGCSGWNYDDWRNGVFYPPGLPARSWLRFYAEQFETVELNATFYRLPRRQTAEAWAAGTPDGFTFAVKVSRYLTHIKRLTETAKHFALLFERIEPLARAFKLGPLLWQLPPTFHRDDGRLAAALAEFPAGLRHAVEFRHESWFADDIMELLRGHNAALVFADRPEIRSYQRYDTTADFTYVRFHHGTRGRRGNYSENELRDWAERIRSWGSRGDVYVYFNNDWEGFAPANARFLRRVLAA